MYVCMKTHNIVAFKYGSKSLQQVKQTHSKAFSKAAERLVMTKQGFPQNVLDAGGGNDGGNSKNMPGTNQKGMTPTASILFDIRVVFVF